ncbi:hypothetical protein LTR53_014058 [Teratosphaeriaceae sp. CCFEE 6253]|nr:hypothetical protein LTR53_014058 [Teratosphaeriaceae sp. CCFEE 6253]
MNQYAALRLTPSNSPYFRSSAPRSPTKLPRNEEPGLRLKNVIGTTTSSANGFDCTPSTRAFAYAAGAAAVLCSVDDELRVRQRHFRARPTVGRESNGQSVGTPTPGEPRSRAFGHVKEHSIGGSPLSSTRDWNDSPTGRTTTAKDRVKAVTSVALSANGKWLAVGETGYKPRILIFSIAEDSADVPVSVISEHTFGVHALRFSPDSKYLASLGTVNDGFLYVWQIDDRTGATTLHASNKCTTLVSSMHWMGTSIVTVGLRFVKIWRPNEEAGSEPRRAEPLLSPATPRMKADSKSSDYGNSILGPRHKVLAGKNTLLGDVLDCNFVCAVPISDTEALVCAETGQICSLDDTSEPQTLNHMTTVDFRIYTAALDGAGALHVFGADDATHTFDMTVLKSGRATSSRSMRRKTISPYRTLDTITNAPVVAAFVDDLKVRLDSKGGVSVSSAIGDGGESRDMRLTGPADAMAGVTALVPAECSSACILTYSINGALQSWDEEGQLVTQCNVSFPASDELYGMTNGLTVAVPLPSSILVATGDKLGVLSVVNLASGSVTTQLRAHSSEIADIRVFQRSGQQLLVTASRDRTLQFFAWRDEKLELLQTMDEHAGAVTSLLVTEDDRSVVVREAWLRDVDKPASVAYVILRTITLKSAPTSMCVGGDPGTILVASTDRSITKYSIKSGQASVTFKCSDSEGGEAAVMSKMLFVPGLKGNPVIAGISSSDKSVRLYSEYGTLLARDWGHTEGVTGIALLARDDKDEGPSAARLATVAADATIFFWDMSPLGTTNQQQQEESDMTDSSSTPKASVVVGPPLRKIMSYAELARLRRESSIEEGSASSPSAAQTPTHPSSPQRLRKKPSRMSVAQAPRLEPALHSSIAESSVRSSRRSSLRQRSPSPPSPRNTMTRGHKSRPSLGMTLRSKSSENVLKAFAAPTLTTNANGFGSLTASTESVVRTLRVYRKKLANTPPSDNSAAEALRELEKELKLTARALGERSQGKTMDENNMARLLDQASEKIVGMLDERIKERVESEVRKSTDGSPLGASHLRESLDGGGDGQADTLAGALEKVALGDAGPAGT